MTIRTVSVTVDVDVDLDEIDTDDLIAELDSRGVECAGGDLNCVFASVLMRDWLRNADPPQAIRDAYFSTFGRMLL